MVTSLSTTAAWFQPSHPNSNQQERGKDEEIKAKDPKSCLLKNVPESYVWRFPYVSIYYRASPSYREGRERERERSSHGQDSSKVRTCSVSWEIILDPINHLGRNWSFPFPSKPDNDEEEVSTWCFRYWTPAIVSFQQGSSLSPKL